MARSSAGHTRTSPSPNDPAAQRRRSSANIAGQRRRNSIAMPRPIAPAQLHPCASAGASLANKSPSRSSKLTMASFTVGPPWSAATCQATR